LAALVPGNRRPPPPWGRPARLRGGVRSSTTTRHVEKGWPEQSPLSAPPQPGRQSARPPPATQKGARGGRFGLRDLPGARSRAPPAYRHL